MPAPASVPVATTARGQTIAFSGTARAAAPSLAYRLHLLVVAVLVTLIPLIYLALVATVAWAVWWHATHDADAISWRGRGGLIVTALFYLAPIIAGVVVVIFMLKPLLARPVRDALPMTLEPAAEPELHAFVSRIAEAVGAPTPTRIDVMAYVNASASPRRGLLSVLRGDMVLTIGMPLLLGMQIRELGGVIAHELGHFAQRGGGVLSYLVRRQMRWLARTVYGRDSWDAWLLAAQQVDNWMIAIIVLMARAAVWLSRRIMWVLLHIAALVSSSVSRQMEYDADGYEARFSGTEGFIASAHSLRLLNAAFEMATGQLRELQRTNRLPADLPELVVALRQRIGPETRRKILEPRNEKSSLFASHPTDSQRAAAVRRLAAPGICHDTRPAAELLRNRIQPSRAVTSALFRAGLGPAFDPARSVDTSVIVRESAELVEGSERIETFFHGAITPLEPIFPRAFEGEALDPARLLPTLLDARSRMRRLAAQAKVDGEARLAHRGRVAAAGAALALHRAGFPELATRALPAATSHERCRALAEESRMEGDRAAARLRDFEIAAQERLAAGCAICRHASAIPEVAGRLEHAQALARQGAAMLLLLGQMRDAAAEVATVRTQLLGVEVLGQALMRRADDRGMGEFTSRLRELARHVESARSLLSSVVDPAGPRRSDGTRANLIDGVPACRGDHPAGAIASANSLLRVWSECWVRSQRRLIAIVDVVEKAIGDRPLPPG